MPTLTLAPEPPAVISTVSSSLYNAPSFVIVFSSIIFETVNETKTSASVLSVPVIV